MSTLVRKTTEEMLAGVALTRKQSAALKAALINQGLTGTCVKRACAQKIGSTLYVSILTQREDGALFEWTGRMALRGPARIRFVCNVAS